MAAALALGRCLPLPAAFALTGLALATPGALAAWTLARAVRRAPAPLAATRAEVEGTLQALRPAGGGA